MRKALFTTVVLSGVMPFVGLGCTTNKGPTFANNNASSDWFGVKKLAALFKPEPEMNGPEQVHESDPTSLAHKSRPPGADLYVATAKLYERRENFAAAEEQYERALKISPNDLGALVGYAHLLDRQGQLEHATNYYRQAVRHHPHDAAAHNDLGLCYARRGMLNESLLELSKAVELAPDKPLYRNNIATVFLEQGQPQKALAHLMVGTQPGIAHYNLACLLHQRGQAQAAAFHFAQAAQHDPSLVAAQEWAQKLSATPAGSRMTNVRPVEQTSAYRPNTQWSQPAAQASATQPISFPPSGPQFREARVDAATGYGGGHAGQSVGGQGTSAAGGPNSPQGGSERNWSAYDASGSSGGPSATASGASSGGVAARGTAYGALPPTPETAGDYGASSADTLPPVEQATPRY